MSKTTKINKDAIVSVRHWKTKKSDIRWVDLPVETIFFGLIRTKKPRSGYFKKSAFSREFDVFLTEKQLEEYNVYLYKGELYTKPEICIAMSNKEVFRKVFESDGECEEWLSTNLEGVNLIEM